MIIIHSVFGGALAGVFMALLNILVEAVAGRSAFTGKDVLPVSLWHALWGTAAGLLVGLAWALWRRISRASRPANPDAVFAAFLAGGALTLAVGTVNIRLIPPGISFLSLASNVLLVLGGAAACRCVFLRLNRRQGRLSPAALIFIGLLVLVPAVSPFIGRQRAASGPPPAESGPGERPNVLILVLDAVRADHLGCYGYARRTSPNIDALAAEGAVFENAFSQSPRTHQSVPSLFTSTYPSTHGLRGLADALPRRMVLLPEVFKAAGYRTAVLSVNPYISPEFGFGKGVDDFFIPGGSRIQYTVLNELLTKTSEYLRFLQPVLDPLLVRSRRLFPVRGSLPGTDAPSITRTLLSWIGNPLNRPFFIYVHTLGAHAPYDPPPPFDTLFDPDTDGRPVREHPPHLGIPYPFSEGRPLGEAEKRNLIARYDGEIAHHDAALGELFDALRAAGLENNTIVVVTADHGEEFFEHRGWGHGRSLFDEVLHVPLIFRAPGLIPEGGRFGGPAALIDLFVTLPRLCGIGPGPVPPYPLAGADQSPLLLGTSRSPAREMIFSELGSGGMSGLCVRTPTSKALILKHGLQTRRMFFDLAADPGELRDIFDPDSEKQAELFAVLELFSRQAGRLQPETIKVDPATVERLKSLGYIQ
ncbi:MAG: sulfatase [Candidatus Aminicenantes bacterium]|nr:sulfatase [Candidatus Aminicenantes bacterium]